MHYRLIDTHCHLEMDVYDGERDEIINRAKKSGIQFIINAGSDRDGNKKALDISRKYPEVFSAVGIHPHDAKTFNQDIYDNIKNWLKQPKVIAIGEIGLDYHYMYTPKEVQADVFKKQLVLAKTSGLPVIIHSREAKNDTLHLLKSEASGMPGVLHCFSGDKDMAQKALDLGFYISIAGPVTFQNADKLRTIARFIPDDRLLIETDAPYLSPVPMRGKRNEPSFLQYTAQVLAAQRGIEVSDIARITTLNAMKLFAIGQIQGGGEIIYEIRNALYLNVSNKCTNQCDFCVKFHTSYVKGHNLRLSREPTAEEIIKAIDDPKKFKEVVFCGLGEPLLRLELVKQVSSWIKQKGGRVRINTNGHGNLIHGRNILPELKDTVDSLSISLDAEDEKKYQDICKPVFKNAFQSVVSFIKEAKKYIPEVIITVVDIPEIDIDRCKLLAEELGVELRTRKFNVVG
jgi:TatD DNase family protein